MERYDDESGPGWGVAGRRPAMPWDGATTVPPPQGPRPPARRGARWLGLALVAATALGGVGLAGRVVSAAHVVSSQVLDRPHRSAGANRPAGGWSGWGGFTSEGGSSIGGRGRSASSRSALTAATGRQQVGIVDIDTVLGFQGRAAGTGMILTSDGEVLTNKHVVDGGTSMTVTVAATGQTFPARVIGTDAQHDVAVIKVQGASGLQPVTVASRSVAIGESVVGVGNAAGLGGTPSAAAGAVIALDQDIVATDEGGGAPERLTGLIETDAPVAPGDSGGPLFDGSDQVVGMDTAGTVRGGPDAFAVPIGTALAAVKRIESGGGDSAGAATRAGSRGARSAYLGVQVRDGFGGALVAGVVPGSPAAAAGLAPGDTITGVDGRPVESVDGLAAVMGSLSPGRRVAVTWTDQDGRNRHAQVSLGGAPTG
ncbi:MAG TPA: trypsin-like peptidase domain-containing protein [Kineosporiaceae bacterium]